MNRTVLVGRLVRDVDLRYTQSGDAVDNFTIAVNRPFKNKETDVTDSDFVICVIWRKPAENIANYMRKGSQIGVDGRLQSRTYQDKDEKIVYVTEVVADSVQFLEPRDSNQSEGGQNKSQSNDDPFKKDAEPIDISDDDLPF